MTDLPARRLLLVHAHPDDESINNGATMARYAAEGAVVDRLVVGVRVHEEQTTGGEIGHGPTLRGGAALDRPGQNLSPAIMLATLVVRVVMESESEELAR